jgi:lipopolysaccharide export system protein LptC
MDAKPHSSLPLPAKPRPHATRIASWVVMAATAGLVAVFAIELASFESLKPRKAPPPDVSELPSNQITAGRSTIAGFDREDEPYLVNAERAVQDAAKRNIVHLTTVAGELRKKDGAVMTVSARGATYDTDSKVLDLEGAVQLASEGRFIADMEKARVFLNAKRLITQVPVTVTLSRGVVTANGLEISDGGKRVLFFNRVRAKYQPASSKENRQ